MGDDGPQDELNRLGRTGQKLGLPHCHASGVPDSDFKKANPCDGVTLPVADMGPHSAAMGVLFYTGSMFPAEYRNSMRVMRKGSWNRTKKFGYDVIRVTADADGRNAKVHPLITAFLDEATQGFVGRPVYALQLPDGSVLISDKQMGAIDRVSYGR